MAFSDDLPAAFAVLSAAFLAASLSVAFAAASLAVASAIAFASFAFFIALNAANVPDVSAAKQNKSVPNTSHSVGEIFPSFIAFL